MWRQLRKESFVFCTSYYWGDQVNGAKRVGHREKREIRTEFCTSTWREETTWVAKG